MHFTRVIEYDLTDIAGWVKCEYLVVQFLDVEGFWLFLEH
jgi:hypothetical protein